MSEVLIIVASSGENFKLAKLIDERLSEKVNTEVVLLDKLNFPLFVAEREYDFSVEQNICLKKVVESQGVVFVSPEYNGGIPPLLSNFIAWMTSQLGRDWRDAFQGKLAGIATFSGNNGNNLSNSLLIMLSHVGMNILGRKIILNSSTGIKEDSIRDFCFKYINMINQISD